jgi:hypothetical protein
MQNLGIVERSSHTSWMRRCGPDNTSDGDAYAASVAANQLALSVPLHDEAEWGRAGRPRERLYGGPALSRAIQESFVVAVAIAPHSVRSAVMAGQHHFNVLTLAEPGKGFESHYTSHVEAHRLSGRALVFRWAQPALPRCGNFSQTGQTGTRNAHSGRRSAQHRVLHAELSQRSTLCGFCATARSGKRRSKNQLFVTSCQSRMRAQDKSQTGSRANSRTIARRLTDSARQLDRHMRC